MLAVLLVALSLGLSNFAAAIGIGISGASLAVAAVIIGAISVGLSLLGLELGSRLGARTGKNGELLGGAVLIGVGIAVAAGVI